MGTNIAGFGNRASKAIVPAFAVPDFRANKEKREESWLRGGAANVCFLRTNIWLF